MPAEAVVGLITKDSREATAAPVVVAVAVHMEGLVIL